MNLSSQRLFLLAGFFLLITACKGPETIVIDEAPEAAAPADSAAALDEEDAIFRHLRIGEVQPVRSFDPLFAKSAADLRAIQLTYEGLVRFNELGEVIPAAAKQWQISDDSLEYRFTIRRDLYFHDSDIFLNGVGRRVLPSDFEFIFRRMANRSVPPETAELFLAIQGFEPFYREQRNVYLESERSLNRITGITIPNDTTLMIRLVERDPKLLEKLALPVASVYPREAISNEGSVLHTQPIGTGPYIFADRPVDSLYIFQSNKTYRYGESREQKIAIDRLDLIYAKKEEALLKGMQAGRIDMIPELGPNLLKTVVAPDTARLRPKYQEFKLVRGRGVAEYRLYYYPYNRLKLSFDDAATMLAQFNHSQFSKLINARAVDVAFDSTDAAAGSLALNEQVTAPLSDDPFLSYYYRLLASELEPSGISFRLLDIRTANRNTLFLGRRALEGFPNASDFPQLPPVLRVTQHTLHNSAVTGIKTGSFGWWLDVRPLDIDRESEDQR